MLNSRQKLAQQLLGKEKEPENPIVKKTKPESHIPPKFKRPLIKEENNTFDNKDSVIINNIEFDNNTNENKFKEIEIASEIKRGNFEDKKTFENLNDREIKVEYFTAKAFEEANLHSKDNHFEKLNNESSAEFKNSKNMGLLGGIIGRSNNILENATSQLFNFFGNLAGNLNSNCENPKADFEKINNYNKNLNEENNGILIIDENSNYKNDNIKEDNFSSYNKDKKGTNTVGMNVENNKFNKKNNYFKSDEIPTNIRLQAEILDDNQEIRNQPHFKNGLVSNGNLKENSNENNYSQNQQTVCKINKKIKKNQETPNVANNFKEQENEINVLKNEINYLRYIISGNKKKEIENNENILNLEITKLNNIIKLKNKENELFANENKNLKNHFILLQEKLAAFLQNNEDNRSIINNDKENNNYYKISEEKLEEVASMIESQNKEKIENSNKSPKGLFDKCKYNEKHLFIFFRKFLFKRISFLLFYK
jgi:hypothetical protein